MGIYLNPRNDSFAGDIKDDMYVDKSGLIRFTNAAIGHPDYSRIVVSRPRRFGKTMALTMLEAYYSRGCDSRALFSGLEIENDPSFERHLNQHNVIILDIQELYLDAEHMGHLKDFSSFLSKEITEELAVDYPDEVRGNETSLPEALTQIHAAHPDVTFIFLLDEWDVLYRDEKHNTELIENYSEFLRGLFKARPASDCISLAYLTGILPVPKQVLQSGLNNFYQCSMVRSERLAEYFGFTQPEVDMLCAKFQMPVQDIRDWYEGYQFASVGSVYCPHSVADALWHHSIRNYWANTAYSMELLEFLNSSSPDFQEAIKTLTACQAVPITIDEDGIDMTDLADLNSALTALVHLGYLVYHKGSGTVTIPNQEVATSFLKMSARAPNNPAHKMIARARHLLEDTRLRNADAVARIIAENHEDFSSPSSYNQENDLAAIVVLSYTFFTSNYMFFRELPSGKGFADIVFLPRSPNNIPIIIELKWDTDADTAIRQIREHRYSGRLMDYNDVLLVEIIYESNSSKPDYRHHRCTIEQMALT